MVFAHDTRASLIAAVDLVNTAGDPDELGSLEELNAFFDDHEYSGSPPQSEDDVAAVRALRPRLRELITSSRDQAVEQVNTMLREADALPQLVRHSGWDWHLHAVDPDKPLATRVLVETAMAMIDVIRADEMSRFSTCADDGCTGIVLDLSRNRSKRFCSTACGNRHAQASFRARQAEDS
ncbi:CGNR zinc finger domain-containing protein [Nocardioides limicola]|uniref:CGNR zinc finger domain-containing protein n=1 Tax=Nocardioides limicola TaxID=2803368 RepID=UPI00193C2BE3|nr:CGNR zinc finger domain-containing protein [Nocardioides sp. DJM-14]